MSCDTTIEQQLGNIFVRPNTLAKAGDITQGHTHNFDHVTFVIRGSVHVRATLPNGTIVERDFGDGTPNGRYFLIRADVTHEFTALVDDVVYVCVYAHRDPQGNVTQHYTGWQEAYR